MCLYVHLAKQKMEKGQIRGAGGDLHLARRYFLSNAFLRRGHQRSSTSTMQFTIASLLMVGLVCTALRLVPSGYGALGAAQRPCPNFDSWIIMRLPDPLEIYLSCCICKISWSTGQGLKIKCCKGFNHLH